MIDTTFQAYLDLILAERHWSWTLPVTLYLLIGFCARGAILGSLINQAKLPPTRYYAGIKHHYLRRAFPGWFFFCLGAALTALAWLKSRVLPLSEEAWSFILGAAFSYLWALVLHCKALGAAALDSLREAAVEKDAEALMKSKGQEI